MDKYSDLVKTLLKNRGVNNTEEAENFLNSNYELHTHDPFLMHGMDVAVAHILETIESNGKIAIYSDFDADGILGGVLMHDFFKKIGYTCFINYIPHRSTEGYGFHKDAVDKLAKDGVSLIITVDVGITDAETVRHARELGVDCIITDHHEVSAEVPSAVAVLNPKQKNCKYPFNDLCGAGVAYKLVQALTEYGRKHKSKAFMFEDVPEGWEKWLLDLVAMATVADMVPLIGENRALVKWGLVVLHKSRRPGIHALCKRLGIKQHLIAEDDIAFMIAPRINAASRMDEPEDAFNLLATEAHEDAINCVSHLEKLNNKRKGAVSSIVREVKKKLKASGQSDNLPGVLVSGNPEWNPALLGLVAGSISDKFSRPVCLWGREGTGILKGSCRSGGIVNIVKMLDCAGDALLRFGGHEAAGGFSVANEHVHTLQETLEKAYKKCRGKENENCIDKNLSEMSLQLTDVSQNIYREVSLLAPFGIGNNKPIFEFKNIKIESIREFGKDKNHIEIFVSSGAKTKVRAYTFFADKSSFSMSVKEDQVVNLFATIEESVWNGRRIELKIVDIM